MPEPKRVRIRIISQKGKCKYNLKVGDEWIVGGLIPGGSICLGAWHNIYPNLRLLRYGGIMPQYPDPDVINVVCPGHRKPGHFRIAPPDSAGATVNGR